MNASELLAWISAAIGLQLAVGLSVAARRKTSPGRASVPAEVPVIAGAWAGWREFRVTGRSYEDPARTQCSFLLEPIDGLPLATFKPGQFLTVALSATKLAPSEAPVGTTVRCYSLSDSPDPARYRITVKRIGAPDGVPEAPAGVASNFLLDRVQVGDVLKIRAPAGHFHLDPDPSVPIVLVAGGIGITPMLSMLGWCIREQTQRPVHLYYGVRNGDDVAFRSTIERAATLLGTFSLCIAYSRPRAGDVPNTDYHHAGHVDVDLIRATLPHGRHQFYVCGPSSMMQELVPALVRWGVPPADVRFEAFGPASVQLPASATESASMDGVGHPDVHFRRSGRTLTWDGRDESLLEFGERHGVVIESGCRSGCCGACQTPLVAGQVTYPRPPEYDVSPGHCLPCVARPRSAVTIEA